MCIQTRWNVTFLLLFLFRFFSKVVINLSLHFRQAQTVTLCHSSLPHIIAVQNWFFFCSLNVFNLGFLIASKLQELQYLSVSFHSTASQQPQVSCQIINLQISLTERPWWTITKWQDSIAILSSPVAPYFSHNLINIQHFWQKFFQKLKDFSMFTCPELHVQWVQRLILPWTLIHIEEI